MIEKSEIFRTTGIGSLPLTDPEAASRFVMDAVDIPFWPQLPARSRLEGMIPQYAEDLPFLSDDGEDLWVTNPTEAAMNRLYASIAAGEVFSMGVDRAPGFFTFLEAARARAPLAAAKGHVTGPITFTLGLTDHVKRPLFFDEEKRELALAVLKGKAVWQIRQLHTIAQDVIVFIDEPILSALGTSTYMGVSEDDASRMLTELADAIRDAGGIPGIHCCGRAHWPLVLGSGIDILNFDAYSFGVTLSLYPEEVSAFLAKGEGKKIAWGIVPTTADELRQADPDDLIGRLGVAIEALSSRGVQTGAIQRQSLLTPSCGTSSLDEPGAARVFSLLREVQRLAIERLA